MPTYLVWNKNQSHCSSAYARQTTQNIQTSKGGKHGARQPLDGITSASEPRHTQKGKRGARQPITGLTSASEPKHNQITSKHTQKRKRLPGVVSHDHLPTYPVWNKDQGDVVPPQGKENLARNRGKTHYQGAGLEPSVVMHRYPTLRFLPTCTTAN